MSFDQAGNVIFNADTIGGTLGFTRGLWMWANGQLSEVIRTDPFGTGQGDIAPGTGGGMFRHIIAADLLDGGWIGLSARVGGGTIDVSSGLFTTFLDTDGDGIADIRDNCPNDFNPAQADTNQNGVGNVCEPPPGGGSPPGGGRP